MLGSTISAYPNHWEFLAKYLKMPNVLQKIHILNADPPSLIASQGDTHSLVAVLKLDKPSSHGIDCYMGTDVEGTSLALSTFDAG